MATLDQATTEKLAEHVENAELNRQDIVKITDDYPDMDWEDAYNIQYAIRARKEARGTRIAGLKMGLTSHAKMKQMGVEQPVYGFLTDYGACPEGGEIDTSRFIHPRVEAEVAVVTNKTLRGPGCHVGAVLAAIDIVLPAVEIIDSRYRDFKFDLKSVVADNTSAAGYVVLGHPAASVAMLANMMAARGEEIPAGTFIMTGGITAAVAVEAGDNINVRYQDLGSLGFRFV
jgi:2-oxo-3-hexenedioate decarboxylase